MRFCLYFIILAIAASIGFVIHVIDVEWLQSWIAIQMEGKSVQPSWSVRYVAMFFSLEHAIAVFVIYLLLREKIKEKHLLIHVVILSVLILSFKMLLIRQPLMDYLIGNPLYIVIIQNLMKWMIPVSMSIIIVFGYHFIEKLSPARSSKDNH